MIVHLRFFAALRERLRAREAEREVPEGCTVADVWTALCREWPEIEPMSGAMAFAVNREYVDRAHRLADGDELALIPPVSGG